MATIQQIKNTGDIETESIWCTTKHAIYGNTEFRIIGIGRKYVRLMSPSGTMLDKICPSDILSLRK